MSSATRNYCRSNRTRSPTRAATPDDTPLPVLSVDEIAETLGGRVVAAPPPDTSSYPVLFAGSDICRDCGEPYSQDGLSTRYQRRHWAWQDRPCERCAGAIDYESPRKLDDGTLNPKSLTAISIVTPRRRQTAGLEQRADQRTVQQTASACGMRKGKIMKTKYCSDEQLTQLIDAPPMPCAALCGVTLSTLNLISGDTVHEDCRCARSCPGARTASRAPVPVRAPPVPRIYEVMSAWPAARHPSTYICSCVS